MSDGIIYIASNKSLKKGLLKIGLTRKSKIEDRITYLSKSSSIPDNFKLEYERKISGEGYLRPVSCVSTAEARIHLLLHPHRYNSKKEFFEISLNDATLIVDRVADHLETQANPDYLFEFTDEYKNGCFNCKDHYDAEKLIYILVALSSDLHWSNSLSLMFLFNDIVSGFVRSDHIAEVYGITENYAVRKLSKLCKRYENLTFFIKSKEELKVFEYFHYYRANAAWKFTSEFRQLVSSAKF